MRARTLSLESGTPDKTDMMKLVFLVGLAAFAALLVVTWDSEPAQAALPPACTAFVVTDTPTEWKVPAGGAYTTPSVIRSPSTAWLLLPPGGPGTPTPKTIWANQNSVNETFVFRNQFTACPGEYVLDINADNAYYARVGTTGTTGTLVASCTGPPPLGRCFDTYHHTLFTPSCTTCSIEVQADNWGSIAMIQYRLENCAGPLSTTSSLSGTLGSNGWYRSAVTVALTPVTPCGSPETWYRVDSTGAFTKLPSTPGSLAAISGQGSHTVDYYTIDGRGQEATKSVTFKIDSVLPTVTGSRSPAANSFGWNNVDVTASWTCTDATSGVGTAPVNQVVTADGASQSRTGTCTDNAGNSASNTVSGISIDKTLPSMTGSRSPAANSFGWNNVDVTASWTCTDALSGVNTGPTPASSVVSTEGSAQSRSSTCTDKAGNSASNTVGSISIDKTAPTLTGSRSPVANSFGWNNGDVTASWTCTDALSGVNTSPANAVVSTEGSGQSRTGTCTDKAGNSASNTVSGISIDKTVPTITGSRTPAANSFGWNNVDVTASWTCTDGLSGVNTGPTPASSVVSTEGSGQTRTSTCADKAGNSASNTVSGISIDKTVPTITGSRTPAANSFGWNNVDVTVSWTCTDGLSGVNTSPASAVVSTEGGGQSRTGTCTDKAGNSASNTVGSISIDKTAPTISGSRSPAANANGWNNVDVTVSWTCTDALSGVATSPADEVLSTEGADQARTATCTDKAGNSASGTVGGISIDKTVPDVAIVDPQQGRTYINDVEASEIPDGPKTIIMGEKTVTADASDALSGVARVEFYVDSSLRATVTEAPYSFLWEAGQEADGDHVLEARAFDRADNTDSDFMDVTTVGTPLDVICRDLPAIVQTIRIPLGDIVGLLGQHISLPDKIVRIVQQLAFFCDPPEPGGHGPGSGGSRPCTYQIRGEEPGIEVKVGLTNYIDVDENQNAVVRFTWCISVDVVTVLGHQHFGTTGGVLYDDTQGTCSIPVAYWGSTDVPAIVRLWERYRVRC